ncbi:MAG: succinylglutamate desuccinylase/aspartoacylase family protein [Mangrovibacterium sp.]
MKILHTEIKKGSSTYLTLETARLHTHTKIEVPVLIERGKKPGPTLLLSAGIHGDEVNGVEIVRRAIKEKITKPECGTVIAIPVLNVLGFLNKTREFPDGKDLNRFFPGSKTGSLANQFAHTFMQEIVPHIDYCIDFHTGGSFRNNIPQIRVSRGNPELLELAEVFNPKYIVQAPVRDKSFRESATKLGKKVLLFEGGKALNFSKGVTEAGLQGIMRVMQHIGMRDFETAISPAKRESIFIVESLWQRARHSGLFHTFVKDGEYITKGQILGSISDPYGKVEYLIKAKQNAHIIGMSHSPIVMQGDALFHLGVEKE